MAEDLLISVYYIWLKTLIGVFKMQTKVTRYTLHAHKYTVNNTSLDIVIYLEFFQR